METISIEILNPKARKLLKDLADLKLIQIKSKSSLTSLLSKLRENEASVPSFDEITKEVESVRKKSFPLPNTVR